MCHSQVLQRALATFIANGAIEWMGSEQELDSSTLSIFCFGSLCENHHALFYFIRTSCFELGHELDLRRPVLHNDLACRPIAHRASDFHKAHTAHADRFKFWMMTKNGDINTHQLGSIYHTASCRNGYLFSINCERYLLCHAFSIGSPSRTRRCGRGEGLTAFLKSSGKRSIPVTTAIVENSPR